MAASQDKQYTVTVTETKECDNCGETEDLIITEDVVTCETCDPACYKCEYRSWKWSIVLCERLDEPSGWNMGLYCMKCIEESETDEEEVCPSCNKIINADEDPCGPGCPLYDEGLEDSEEEEVTEIEFEGATYWVGEDNTVYGGEQTDPQVVGTWNADEKRVIFH